MSDCSQPSVVFRNALLVDGSHAEPSGIVDVLVADGMIKELSETRISAANSVEYDLSGRTVMPSLIDLYDVSDSGGSCRLARRYLQQSVLWV